MPCWEQRKYVPQVIKKSLGKDGVSIDVDALILGLKEVGMRLDVRGSERVILNDLGEKVCRIEGANTLKFEVGQGETYDQSQFDRINQAYSVGTVVKEASAKYWSPKVVNKNGKLTVTVGIPS